MQKGVNQIFAASKPKEELNQKKSWRGMKLKSKDAI